MLTHNGPLRVGVGGPVGSGKTALMDALCKRLRDRYEIAAITNDIYTKWDAEYLVRSGALVADRIAGVETGGCPHTAIREDASANLAAIADMRQKFPALDLVLIESGGDNLAATFSPELADLTIYVIDVAAGDKIPSKGGPRHHPLGSAGDQQGRSRAACRRVAGNDGARIEKDARCAAVRVHQSARRQRALRRSQASSRKRAGYRHRDAGSGAEMMKFDDAARLQRVANDRVIIAGGGIGGLAMALTLHQIGVPCIVFEAAREMRPLGVGINLQPNAVRELADLGLTERELDRVGVPAKEWALVGLNGNDVYAEPRGLLAGYTLAAICGASRPVPHAAVSKGRWSGSGRMRSGWEAASPATGKIADGGVTALIEARRRRDLRGERRAADRRRRHPLGGEGADAPRSAADPLGRRGHVARHDAGRSRSAPALPSSASARIASASSSIRSRIPIRGPAWPLINWIAEVTIDNSEGWKQSGWFRQVGVGDFIHHFDTWVWDWLDVPALIGQADSAFENPMIDRDPVPTWRDGPVVLIGDAAHAMYPTGSNGGSQAIVDARILGAAMVEHGVTQRALAAYDDKLCGPVSQAHSAQSRRRAVRPAQYGR